MITMDFVSAMEEAIQLIQKDPINWAQTFRTRDYRPEPTFPNPLSHTLFPNNEAVDKLLYGHLHDANNNGGGAKKGARRIHTS
jgi:hypothetical protein